MLQWALHKGPAAVAVSATVAALTRDRLPAVQEFETLLPPVARAFVRHVSGFNLWLLHVFDDAEVEIVTVTNTPPFLLTD